jgi:hypothetical protein
VAFQLYSGTFERVSRREDLDADLKPPKTTRSSGVSSFRPHELAFRDFGAPVDNLWKTSSSNETGVNLSVFSLDHGGVPNA